MDIKREVNRKKYIWRFILLVTFVTFLFVFKLFVIRYLEDFYNRQEIGHYLKSELETEIKRNIGKDSCINLQQITIEVKGTDKFQRIIDSIYAKNYQYDMDKFLYYLGLKDNQFNNLLMPKMDYLKGTDGKGDDVWIKLAGGQLDHFDSHMPTYRIKSKKPIIEGCKKVNLFHPKARNGAVNESFSLFLLKENGLIALKNGNVTLILNHDTIGAYYYQEHPTLSLGAHHNRENGVVIRLKHLNGKRLRIANIYQSKKVNKTLIFREQLDHIEKMISKYNAREIDASEIFSIRKLAKLWSIVNLVNGYHGAEIRNMYFYFNPEDSLLEPVAREFSNIYFDPAGSFSEGPPLYYLKVKRFNRKEYRKIFDVYYLSDKSESLLRYLINTDLQEFTEKSYLESIFKKYSNELKSIQQCTYKEYPIFSSFDKNHFYDNQDLIRKFLIDEVSGEEKLGN